MTPRRYLLALAASAVTGFTATLAWWAKRTIERIDTCAQRFTSEPVDLWGDTLTSPDRPVTSWPRVNGIDPTDPAYWHHIDTAPRSIP